MFDGEHMQANACNKYTRFCCFFGAASKPCVTASKFKQCGIVLLCVDHTQAFIYCVLLVA